MDTMDTGNIVDAGNAVGMGNIGNTPDTVQTDLFDNALPYTDMGTPDLPTQFDNPFTAGQSRGSLPSNEDPLKRTFLAELNKPASFAAQTAPGYFDWEGSNADRYVNSTYYKELGFDPDRDNETLYGHRQTWGNTFKNAFAGGGGLAWNTFVDGWYGWGRMVSALSHWDASRLMGTPEELAELNKEQNRIMQKYAIFKTPESEASTFSRQFLGDMVQQSGFAVGTLAQFVAEELLTMGASTPFKAGARAIEGVAEAGQAAEAAMDMKRLMDTTWKGKTATKLYEGLKVLGKITPAAGNLFDAGLDAWKARTYGASIWEAGGITLNGLKRTMAEANMAFTESRMEAAGTYGELKTQLMADTFKEKGEVSYEDQQHIEQMAQGAAWSNFKVNAAVLSISNRLEHSNLFQAFRSGKRVAGAVAEAGLETGEGAAERLGAHAAGEGAEHAAAAAEKVNKVTGMATRDITNAAGEVTIKAGNPFTQLYEKGTLGTFGNLKMISADFGGKAAAWEAGKSVYRNLFKWELKEGVEELTQEASNNAIKDYYSDLYSSTYLPEKTRTTIFSDTPQKIVPSAGNSLNKAVHDLWSTNGLKIFLMGAVTGRLIAPINRGLMLATNRVTTNKADRTAQATELKGAVGDLNTYFRDPMAYNKEAMLGLKSKASLNAEDANHIVDAYYSDPAKFAPEAVADLKAQNVSAQKMEAAIANNDQYTYEHAKDSAFAKAVSAAKKLNMVPSLTDTIRAYGDHLNEQEFNEAFGIDVSDSSHKPAAGMRTTVKQYMNRIADEVDAFSNRYDTLRETYGDLIKPERYKEGGDRSQALLAKRSLDEAIEWIASNEYRAQRTAKRRLSIMEDAVKLPTVGQSAYMAFRILGDDRALKLEANLLKEEIASLESGDKQDKQTQQQLEWKKQQYEALKRLDGDPAALEKVKDNPSEEDNTQEEEKSDDPLDAVQAYVNAKNKESGIDTTITPGDLQKLSLQLRDYRRLHKDGQDFMDAYALLANPKKFRGLYMRIQGGLQHLKQQQQLANQIQQVVEATAASATQQAPPPNVKDGNSIDEYHGFKEGDRFTHDGFEYTITGISTTGLELSYNNKKLSIPLGRFDEMVADKNEQLTPLASEERFKNALPPDMQLAGGPGVEGVFIAKYKDEYGLIDKNGDPLFVKDDEHILESETPYYKTLAEAEAARKKLVALNKANKAAEETTYVFDGKTIGRNDVLIDEEGKRYRVLTSKAAFEKGSEPAKEGEEPTEQPTIKVEPIAGGEAIELKDLQGYERALDTALQRAATKGNKQVKLTVPNISTRVSAIPREGETQQQADGALQDFILKTSRKDMDDFLTIAITKRGGGGGKKSGAEATKGSTVANAGKADENKNLRVNTPSLEVVLKYKNDVIGQMPYFNQYQFQNENGEPVDTDNLTAAQFAKIFDTSLADSKKLLHEFKQSYQQGKDLYNHFQTLAQSTTPNKPTAEIKAKDIQKLFNVTVLPGVPDYVAGAGTALKDLKYKGVDGKTAVITLLTNRTSTDEEQGLITDPSMSSEDKNALSKRIDKQRDDKRGGNLKELGPYVAVVELPNKELQFLSLTTPAASIDELNEMATKLSAQNRNFREGNVDEKTKNELRASTNRLLSQGSYIRIPGANMRIRLNMRLDGDLAVNVDNWDLDTHETAVVKAPEGKALTFANFSELLKAINDSIKEHDRDANTPALAKIGVQLTAENFRQHLEPKTTTDEINGMPVNVSANVLRDASVSIIMKKAMPSLFSIQYRPGIAKENVLQPEAEKEGTEIPMTATGPEATAPTQAEVKAGAANKGTTATGAKQPTTQQPATGATQAVKGTKSTAVAVPEKPVELRSNQTPEAQAEADKRNAKEAELTELKLKLLTEFKKMMRAGEATKAVENHPSVIELQQALNDIGKPNGVPKIVTSDQLHIGDIESIKKFREWVTENLPAIISVDERQRLEANMLSKGITVGKFITYLQQLNTGKTEVRGTIAVKAGSSFKYHEAFHSVFRLLLTDEQINNYLAKAKKEVAQDLKENNSTLAKALKDMRELAPEYYKDMPDKELEERYYEEHLADRFDKWKMDASAEKDTANKSLFRKIWDMIRNVIRKLTRSEVEGLFYEINSGKYKGASVAANRFTTDPNLNIAPVVALKSIKLGDRWIQDEDGRVVKVNEYLPEEKGTPLAAAIAAVFYNRSQQAAPGTSANDILEEILDDYADLYDKNNEQYAENRDKIGSELDKLVLLFSFGREQLKEAVRDHLKNIDYMQLADEEDEEDKTDDVGDRTIAEYGKNKESLGGFENLSKELRQYISTTVYTVTDSYGNRYLKEGEPLLQAVNANLVYAGILKAVAGTTNTHLMLLRMQEFAKTNEQSGHFIRRFFKDVGINEVRLKDYDAPTAGRGELFMRVIKGFQQYTPDYLFFIKDVKTGVSQIVKANTREASQNQFSIWNNGYNHVFGEQLLQTTDGKKAAFLKNVLFGFNLFQSLANEHAIDDTKLQAQSQRISDELAAKLGMRFSPLFIQYSLLAARPLKHLTDEQKRMVKAYKEVAPMLKQDAAALSRVITAGESPFVYSGDIEELEGLEKDELNKQDGDYRSNAMMRMMIGLAKANAIFDETVNTISFRNANNELVYAHQLPTFHLIRVSDLANNTEEALAELRKDPFMARNFLTTQADALDIFRKLKLARIEGMTLGEAQAGVQDLKQYGKGVTYGDFTGREMALSLFELYGAMEEFKTAEGKTITNTRHLIRVIEATNTGDTVNLPVTKAVEYKGKQLQLTEAALDAMVNEVQSEFERILRVKEEQAKIADEQYAYEKDGTPRSTKEIDDYHNGELRGTKLFKTGIMLGDELKTALEKEAQEDEPNFKGYKDRIREQLQKHWTGQGGKVDELIGLLKEKEIIGGPKDVYDAAITNVLLPKFMVEGVTAKKQGEATEKNTALNLISGDLRHNIAQVLVNDFLNTNAINQVLLGDQAVSLRDFVDMVKRAKGASGGGASIASEVTAPSLGIDHTNLYSHVVHIKSPLVFGKYSGEELVSGKYSGKNRAKADSQMWMTLKSLRYTLFGLGKLTTQRAALLDKIEQGESVTIRDIFGKGGSIEFNGQTNSIKLKYYDGKRYIKTSGFLLTKEFTSFKDSSGNWKPRPTHKELDDLRMKLEAYEAKNDTICMAIDKTASKGEKANVANEVSAITDWNFQRLDNRFWCLQSENPSNKLVITDPTQVKQMILSEQRDDLEVQFAWDKDLNTDAKITVGELKKKYLQTSAQRERVKYEQVRNELFDLQDVIAEVNISLQQHKITPKLANFQRRAMEVLRTTGADSQMLEFFELNDAGQPKYNLNQPAILDKFTQLFLAYFSKGVMSEKIPGRAVTMVSNFGARVIKEVLELTEDGQPKRWRTVLQKEYEKNAALYKDILDWEHDPNGNYVTDEQKETNRYTKRMYYSLKEQFENNQAKHKPTYVIDDLRHNVPEYAIENGKIKLDDKGNEIIRYRYNEMLLAPHTPEEMALMQEGKEIPEVVALSFGTRIPTLDRGSGSVNRVIDFLPAYYGSSGIFAPEVLEASDADFDLDKEYGSTKDYYTSSKNGETSFVEYGKTNDPEEQFDEYVRYQKKHNSLFRQKYRELLLANPLYARAQTNLDELADLIDANEDRDDLLEQITGKKLSFRDFKQLAGAAANEVTDWKQEHKELVNSLKRIQQETTYEALRALSLPDNVDAYVLKVKNDGEQNIGKLNNMILDAKVLLQSNEHMVNGERPIAYRPTTPDLLKNMVDVMEERFPVLEKLFSEGKVDIDTITGKIGAFENVKEGAKNIGPAVNSMLTFAVMNTFKVSLREKTGEEKDERRKDLWQFTLNGKPFNSYKEQNAYNFETKAYDGERIFSVLSSIVAAMTDNAKERLASKLGLNIEAVGLVSNLVAQGVPLESAITFILQPIIREYYRKTKNQGASIKTEQEEGLSRYATGRQMLAALKAKLPLDAKPLELTDALLHENITTEGKNAHYEYSVLDSFLNLQRQNKYFAAVASVLKLAKGMGTSHEAGDGIEEKIDLLKLGAEDKEFNYSYVPFDLRQMLTGKDEKEDHNAIVANYLKIFNEVRGLSESLFMERTAFFKRIVNVIKSNLNVWGTEGEIFKKQLKRDLLSFLGIKAYMKLLKDGNRADRSISLSHAMVFEAEKEKMPETFMDIIDVVRAIRERLKDNYFAHKFLNAIPTSLTTADGEVIRNPYNDRGINKAEVNTWAKLNQLQVEKLQDSFLDIYQNKETRPLAWALFHYLLVKDGGQFRKGSFIRYIPNFMFQDFLEGIAKVNEVMANGYDEEGFKRVLGVSGDELFNEFIRGYLTNVGNKKYLPQIDVSTSPKELVLQKTGNEEVDKYIPNTFGLSESKNILEINMWAGIRSNAMMEKARQAEEGVEKFTDVENAKLNKNKESLRAIGFRTENALTTRGERVSTITLVNFPYVIRSVVKEGSILKEYYYVLQSVNKNEKGREKKEKIDINPASFLDSDKPMVQGTTARYVLYEGSRGSISQWKGAFVFGNPDTTALLRERPAIVNHPGYDLDEATPAPEVAVKRQKSSVDVDEVVSKKSIIPDFQDRHGVDVVFEEDKGVFFEKNGQRLPDQSHLMDLLRKEARLATTVGTETGYENSSEEEDIGDEVDPDYATPDEFGRNERSENEPFDQGVFKDIAAANLAENLKLLDKSPLKNEQRVVRNAVDNSIERVLAPNGKDSILYKHILEHMPARETIDPLVADASEKGSIGDPNLREEQALVYWALGNMHEGKERIEDKNGEPIYPLVRWALGFGDETDVVNEVKKISNDSLVGYLRDKKIISGPAKNGSYELSAVDVIGDKTDKKEIVTSNLNRIKTILSWFDIPESILSVRRLGGKVLVEFDKFFKPVSGEGKGPVLRTNALTLIDFLKERFPQLKIEVHSEKQAQAIYNDLQQRLPAEQRRNVDFAGVKSFVYKGTVYVIENRVDNETLVEEVLHPFTYTMAVNNKELFDELHAAAIKDFPELHKEVESNYTSAAGFTKEDRGLELVTKALGKTFEKEYEANEPRGIMKLLSKILDWFKKLVEDFGAFIGGKKQTIINVAKLPAGINLTQIAQLLNTYDSQFLVDTSAPVINYRASTERDVFFQKQEAQANGLQKRALKDLRALEQKSVFTNEGHVYTSVKTGDELKSTTTAIGGKFEDPDRKYEMNRLFGNAFDKIMQRAVEGYEFDEIRDEVELQSINLDLAERAYEQIRAVVLTLQGDDNIIIPQLRVSDDESETAGSLDLLVIRPNGSMMIVDLKVSKNSVHEESYSSQAFPTLEGTRLTGHRLSKRQRHGIQLGVYKRLLEVNGFYPEETKTFHIWVDVDGEGLNQVVKRFSVEGWEEHLPSENREMVDKIVPTRRKNDVMKKYRAAEGMDSLANAAGEVDEETRQTEEYQNVVDRMRVKMEDFSEKIHNTIDRMQMVRNAASLKPTKEAIQKLSELLTLIREDLSRGQADRAYGQFLNHAKEELLDLNSYLSNPSNKNAPEYIQRALDADMYVKTYFGIAKAPELDLGNLYQNRMLGEVQDLLDKTQRQIDKSLKDYVLEMLKLNSSKDLTDEEWEHIIKQHMEISKADLYLADIDTSIDPLVAVAAKLYKQAKLRALTRSERFMERAEAMGNKLAQVFGGAPDYDMIIEKDADGKYTGRIVQKIGSQFWKLQKEAKRAVLDEEDRMKQYKPVYDITTAKEEDIAYNRQLYKDKKAWRAFNQAEIRTGDKPEDGNYFKYIQEFKDARDEFEVYVPPHVTAEGKQRPGRWKRNKDKTYREYVAYREKYYYYSPAFDMPVMDENNEFTGGLLKNGGKMWSVKSDYVEVREIAGDGTDMRSEKWRALQEPTNGPDTRTEQQKEMKEFYDFYTEEMEKTLEMLPIEIQKEMMGEMARVKADFVDRMKVSPSFFKAAAKGVTDWFSVRTYAKSSLYNEDGTPMGQIPLFYVGSLRNEKRVEGIEKKLAQLETDYKSKTIERKAYLDDKKRIKEELRVAQNAPSADELEKNLVKSLIKFRGMAESYNEMQQIEGSLIAVKKLLGGERIYNRKSAATGGPQKEKDGTLREIIGENSYTYKRFKEWMEMTFYNSSDVDKSTFDVVAKKMMQVTSLEAIGLNILGPIHNYAMARLNTAIEIWGGLFFSKEAGRRAALAFNTEFLPGYIVSIGQKDGYYYKTKRAGSKYEAVEKYFHIMRPNESGDGRGPGLGFITSYGYLASEAGEYAAQTKSGIAYLMHTMLTRKMANPEQTPETLSVYDALNFDPKTGLLTWKEGYEPEENERHRMTNYIWEMNKQIHGNYAWEDRMLIQKDTLGQMAAQFHKFVYPMFKARFQSYYHDENLGEMEGRYRTVAHFAQFFYEAQGSLLEKIKEGWGKLEPFQIKNMYRNFAELAFLALSIAAFSVFKGLAAGRDKDDKWMKRFLNYLSWESSRQSKEILFWIPVAGLSSQIELIKNPFAMAGSYGKFADALLSSAGLALPPYDDSKYYSTGPFKGQLKAAKKIKDLIPFWKDWNRVATFDQVTKFYVK